MPEELLLHERLARYRESKGGLRRCPECSAVLLSDQPSAPCPLCLQRANDADLNRSLATTAPTTAVAATADRRRRPPSATTTTTAAAPAASTNGGPKGGMGDWRDRVVGGWRMATWVKLLVCVLLLAVAVELAVVPIYIIGLVFFAMYETTEANAHKRRPGQKSAYSVFNKNFEKLQGTFDAEQIDAQYRTGRLM
jgi:hypothetical protein